VGVKTGIEWTDATWNPIRGCSRVSEGCRHCYAESVAYRFSGPGLAYEGLAVLKNGHPSWTGKIEFVEKHLLDPLKWATPRRIFVNSMSDLFHEGVTDEMRDKIFAVMALCPQHTFQVLTKRPERMLAYLADREAALRIIHEQLKLGWAYVDGVPRAGDSRFPLISNLWLGVSVEDQKTADERIPLLLETPAAVRFISAEPLLGKLEIESFLEVDWPTCDGFIGGNASEPDYCTRCHGHVSDPIHQSPEVRLDWVICGGESGPGARPMDADWARGLRDRCSAAGVPFFFKQWGEWLPSMQDGADNDEAQELNCSDQPIHVGKHKAGALLDGVEWKQFPESEKVSG
jgi:protein gp37